MEGVQKSEHGNFSSKAEPVHEMFKNVDIAPHEPKGAEITIVVSLDKLKASAIIHPPEEGGAGLTHEQIRNALEQKKIVFGISEDSLKRMVSEPVYDEPIDFAYGVPCVNGDNAEIHYIIRKEIEIRPKELEDGSVDYKDLGIVENVTEGNVLCEKTPATPGTPGTDVYGQTIVPRPGKDTPMPMGKGTVLSEDKLQLLAAIAGQAEYVNHKINVLNIFTVNGDVSLETGNIIFVGSVVVRGNVLSGLTVQASGSVNIDGMVEAASIIAGGDIIIKGGFNGMGKGRVQSDGKVVCKYIQAGSVVAKGNIEAGYSYNATIRTGGSLRIIGKRGIIVGGHVMAADVVECAFYGGRNRPVMTVVEVGNDPSVITRHHEIPGEIAACGKNLAAAKRLQSILLQLKAAQRLDDEKAGALSKVSYTVDSETIRLSELEEELTQVTEKLLTTGYGRVIVGEELFACVKVIIGVEIFVSNTEMGRGYFIRKENGIVFNKG